MTPTQVHAIQDLGEPPTLIVKGLIQRKDGSTGTGRAQVIFGRFGTPIELGPSWVQELMLAFRKLGDRDAQA